MPAYPAICCYTYLAIVPRGTNAKGSKTVNKMCHVEHGAWLGFAHHGSHFKISLIFQYI
jgi:hypothetical protein